MAEISKFFNAVEIAPGVFDREYQASDFADYLDSMLSSGLINTDDIPGMIVSVESGTLNTIVSPGKAIIKGHLYKNTTPLTLTHNIPEATLNRIDRIVLRWDTRNQSRFIKSYVKEGVPSATPIAPVLQRDNFIYELSLAQILVRANTVQLLESDLVDERLDENLCGLATWNPKVPTGQFQKQWDEFMAGIVDSGFASAEELATHKADLTYQVATGTATALTVPMATLVNGYSKTFIASVTSTSTTKTINGKPFYKPGTTASPSLIAGKACTVWYVATKDCFFIKASAEGTAIATQVLAGVSFSNDIDTGLPGAMPNHGAANIKPGTFNQAIPAGYHNGSGIVQGSPNLTPLNIKKGTTVFDVVGTLETHELTAPASITSTSGYKQKTSSQARATSGNGSQHIKVKAREYTINKRGTILMAVYWGYEDINHGRAVGDIRKNGSIIAYVDDTTQESRQARLNVEKGDKIEVYIASTHSYWWVECRSTTIYYQDNWIEPIIDVWG